MDKKVVCSKCGGQISPFDYVCDYCGNVIFENIKTTQDSSGGTLGFEEGMNVVQQNLDALQDLPKPSFGKTIKAALRILVALYTFGIVLIFWRRPKKRFDRDIYNKLKLIIHRNISFLKLSSKGNSDLMSRIKIYEDEFNTIDKQIKTGIWAKNIANVIVIGIFVMWWIYVANQEPKKYSSYLIKPFDTIVVGNLNKNIKLYPDSCIISHRKAGSSYEWEVDVRLDLKKIENKSKKKLKFDVFLVLVDNKGIEFKGFEPAELTSESKTQFESELLSQANKIAYFRFLIKNSYNHAENRDTIPPSIRKFILKADTASARY